MRKLNYYLLLLFFLPSSAFGESLTSIHENFNKFYINRVANQIKDLTFSPGGKFYTGLFVVLIVIALFITIKDKSHEIVTELITISFTYYFAAACVGTVPHPFSGRSEFLADALYMEFKDVVTLVENNLFGSDVEARFAASWAGVEDAIKKSDLIAECNGDKACIEKASSGESEKKDEESILSKVVPDVTKYFSELMAKLSKLTSGTFWLFLALSVSTFLVRVAGMGVFITYTLGVTSSLFFFKMIVPFAILPSQRQQVLSTIKIPLSFALWSFIYKLFLSLFIVMNTSSFQAYWDSLSSGDVALPTDIFAKTLLFALTVLVVNLVFIAVMFRIPKLAKELMNLSFTSLVDILEAATKDAFGKVLSAGATLLTGGAAGVGAAVGAMAGSGGGGDNAVPPTDPTGGPGGPSKSTTSEFSNGGAVETSSTKRNNPYTLKGGLNSMRSAGSSMIDAVSSGSYDGLKNGLRATGQHLSSAASHVFNSDVGLVGRGVALAGIGAMQAGARESGSFDTIFGPTGKFWNDRLFNEARNDEKQFATTDSDKVSNKNDFDKYKSDSGEDTKLKRDAEKALREAIVRANEQNYDPSSETQF